MNKKTKIIIITAAALIVVAVILAAVIAGKGKTDDVAEKNDRQVQQVEEEISEKEQSPEKDDEKKATQAGTEESEEAEEKVYTPTFMYFISSNDADFDKTNEVIERLKKEYAEKVTFDIRNVDEDPSQLENFPVEGQTPALIMLNTKNDISNFLFQNGNYEELKAAIEGALE